MFPESHIFKYFRKWGMRNVIDLEGMKMLVNHFQKKDKYSALRGNVSVLPIENLSSALSELQARTFRGKKAFLVQHRWAHFTPVFVQMGPEGNRVVIADSGDWMGGHPWVRETQEKINSSTLSSPEIYTFAKARQADFVSCPIFSLRDVLESTKVDVFEYVKNIRERHPSQITKASPEVGQLDNLSVVEWHPENFMKTSQRLTLVEAYKKANPESKNYVGEDESLEKFLQKNTETGIVGGKLKPINFSTRKTAFKYSELILKAILDLE
jgi:hypothetical protein